MSPSPVSALIAVLSLALIGVSTACLVLWRRVRALSPGPSGAETAGVEVGSTPAVSVPLPLPAPSPEAKPSTARYEVARRLDELAGRHRTLEARLSKVEASAADAALAIALHSGAARIRVDRGSLPVGPTLIAVPNLAAPPAPSTASEAAAELDRRFGDVWAMADAGAPVEAISRESGYPIGQVELILGLRRQALPIESGSAPGVGNRPDA